MQITIEKKINETLEVKPGYYKDRYGMFCCITDSGSIIKVANDIIVMFHPGDSSHSGNVLEAMEGVPITSMEFIQKFNQLQLLFQTTLNDGTQP